MTSDELRERLEDTFPESVIVVRDLTGGGDHYDVTVESIAFEGKRLIQQHKMVYACVQSELDRGEIHAFKLTTRAPTKGE